MQRYRNEPRYRLTDAGNSLRFTADHAERLIFVQGPGWHVWDGRRWKLDNEGAPIRAAKETAHRIRKEAGEMGDQEVAKAVFAWAIRSEGVGRIKAMVDLARRGERNTPGLLTDISKLDSKPHLLNCLNGTINLKTGRLHKHDPEDFITRVVDVSFDPRAKAPRWRRFLREVFEGDQDMIAYVQRCVGYSLTGANTEQVMFLAHGEGANGKSVFMETIASVMGEWAVNAAAETFVSSGRTSGTGIPNDLARMRGARLVRVPETEDRTALARQIIKRITGGDKVSARFLFREWFEYDPVFKVWLVTNHLPAIPFGDFATWRRIRVLPFSRTFNRADQDQRLAVKLRAELPGILAWAVQGARLWYRQGLDPVPLAAQLARDDYHARQDTTGRFLGQEIVDDPEANTAKTELYAAYKEWCASEGLPPNSRNAFYAALRERGYTEAKVGDGVRVFRGIRPL